MVNRQVSFNIDEEGFKQVSGLFNTAYKDYLASRTLLNSDQLYRAIILANTAIEKYLKVFNAVRGKKMRTHNALKLFNEAKKFDPNLSKVINEEFIKLISDAYNMRYFDNANFNDPTKEFHVCVPKFKILAELDSTVWILKNTWKVQKGEEVLENMFDDHIKNKNVSLYENHYILNTIDKTSFIEVDQLVYEIRNNPKKGVLEFYYIAESPRNDGKFL